MNKYVKKNRGDTMNKKKIYFCIVERTDDKWCICSEKFIGDQRMRNTFLILTKTEYIQHCFFHFS